jgi:hypothetical protein
MDKLCPHCGNEVVLEDLGDHPTFLSGTCDNEECGKSFSYDTQREEWYDENGDELETTLGDL